jgi:GTP-binding protein
LKITAEFIRSAASAADLPADGLPELAMVGRSNVGKSSLINALLRQRVARTSGTPGKTRLANIFRVQRGTAAAFHLVDLPGFGFARGGANEFAELTRVYFDRPGLSALLLVDSRHPGLALDVDAWQWLERVAPGRAIVATKIDKLARGQRIRAMRELESVFEHSVLPVSAVTGEGLDELWKLIARLLNSPPPLPHSLPRPQPPKATAPRTTASSPTKRTAESRQRHPTQRPPRSAPSKVAGRKR